MQLSDRAALVTGAARRLGAQIARTLHQNGANLIIHYRGSRAEAAALVDELNGRRAGSARACQADLGRDEDIERLAAVACGAFGGLDLLVNNASEFTPTRFGEIGAADWDALVGSNFRAPLFLTQACHPALEASGGAVVNLLDIYATRPLAGHSLYCAAKAANQMLVQALALDLAPRVRVNGVAPGAILWPEDAGEAQQQALLERIPLGRRGEPQDIADAVLFLATSAYVSGEVIRVDGGRSLNI